MMDSLWCSVTVADATTLISQDLLTHFRRRKLSIVRQNLLQQYDNKFPPAHGGLCSLPGMSPTATINPPPNWPCWNLLQAGEGSPRCFQTSSHTWREQWRTVWEETCTHGPTITRLLAYLLVSPPCYRHWAGIGQKDAEREMEFDHSTVAVTLLHPFHLLSVPFDYYFLTGYANITLWWLFIYFLAVYLPHTL